MKTSTSMPPRFNAFVIGCLAFVAVAIYPKVQAENLFTNTLSIHLLENKVPRELLFTGSINLENLKLKPVPVLSDRDFIAYNTTNHAFAITAKSSERLSELLGSRGWVVVGSGENIYSDDWADTPFVLVTSGQRIYLGVFSSNHSSTFYHGTPTIFLVRGGNSTNSVTFTIKEAGQRLDSVPVLSSDPLSQTIVQSNSALLRQAIPPPDVRNDARIIEAVKRLKL